MDPSSPSFHDSVMFFLKYLELLQYHRRTNGDSSAHLNLNWRKVPTVIVKGKLATVLTSK